MVFVISVFGDRFIGMLNTCLYSIKENTNKCDVVVFWQDVDIQYASIIERSYIEYRFIQTKFDIKGNRIVKISSKTIFWEYAAKEVVTLGYSNACFLDVDTLVLRDIQHL